MEHWFEDDTPYVIPDYIKKMTMEELDRDIAKYEAEAKLRHLQRQKEKEKQAKNNIQCPRKENCPFLNNIQ
jgi:hypothetical protein